MNKKAPDKQLAGAFYNYAITTFHTAFLRLYVK